MSTFSEPSLSKAVRKSSLLTIRSSSRAAKWVVGLAAAALLSVSIAGYLYHRFQMAEIAAEHLRLMVIGPSILHPGISAQFDISTTQVTSTPVSIPVEVDLYSPNGKRLLGRKESTDQQGRLQVAIPADMSLPDIAVLKVAALHRGMREEMSAHLAVDAAQLLTQVSLDKPIYQPGETVFYRSLTLSRIGFAVDREIPVRFEILDPSGAVVPNSQIEGKTDRGVGNGAFSIPDNIPGGQYILLVSSLDGLFPQEKQNFLIRRYRLQLLKKELEFQRNNYAPGDTVTADFTAKHTDGGPATAAKLRILAVVDGQTLLQKNVQTDNAGKSRIEFKLPEQITRGDGQLTISIDDGGTRETIAKSIPINLKNLDVLFYPEGGNLAAGLENRVYFVCRNRLGRPVSMSGIVVSGNDNVAAEIETIHDGMGQFSFIPQPGEAYRLKVISPADVKYEPKLPAAATNCPIVLTTGAGVFNPSEPLEFNIRSAQADLPLVVGAWCRGILVGQVALVAKKNENGMNPVILPLPEDIGGVIRLTVFDYSVDINKSGPQFPKPLAERLVYRRSARRLNVRPIDNRDHYAPGEKVNMSLAVTNEKNEPVAAVLGVSVIDKALLDLAVDHSPAMPTYFLLTSQIENPQELENADFYLSDDKSSPVPPAVALDLLLGTQGWRRFTDKTRQQSKEEASEKDIVARLAPISGASSPPTMYDNLSRIQAEYQKSLAAYQSDQTQILYTVIPVSFLAACGLLLLVMMLGLLHIVRGASYWLSLLATIACCAIIGALLTSPQRLASDTKLPVPFLPYTAPVAESDANNDVDAGKKSEKTADKPGPAQSNRRPEGAAALPGLASQLEQVIARPNYPRVERPKSGPTTASKNEGFIVRQYAHRYSAGQAGSRGDFAESIFWNPLLITGPDGKVSINFDLPDSITTFRLQADAHGAGRIGSTRLEMSTQVPLEQSK